MADPSTDSTGTAGRALRRRWPVLIAVAVAVTALSAVLAVIHSPTYKASASVFVHPLPGNPFSSDVLGNSAVAGIALNTEASLVQSAAVTRRVEAALGTSLRPGAAVKASVPAESQLIVIRAEAGSAADARRYATAYSTAFLDYRAALARESQRKQLAQLDAEEAVAHRRLASAGRATNVAHPAADAAAELQVASAQLSAIQTRIGEVQALDLDPGTVVRPASSATTSVWGRATFIVAAGLLVGLLLGFGAALWSELHDDRLRAEHDAALDGVPVLGRVSPAGRADAIRDVRTGLIAAAPDGCVVAVAPITAAEAAATAELAVALARSLAAAGYDVVLVDAVLDEPRVGQLLDLGDGPGLSELVADSSRVAKPSIVDGMRVLPAGSRVEQARERYGGTAMTRLLDGLRAGADHVVVVSPRLDSPDGSAVLRTVERLLPVATDGVSRRSHVRDALVLGERLGAVPTGVITVAANTKRRAAPELSGAPTAAARTAPIPEPEASGRPVSVPVRAEKPPAQPSRRPRAGSPDGDPL